MTSPLINRTKLGTNTTAIAMAASFRLAPNSAATVSARTRGGKENRASISRMTVVSNQPRKYPAINPIGRATTMAIPTISKVARSETRAPQMRRLKMSRPRSSVPSQCAPDGAALRALRSAKFGLYGAINGAAIAATVSKIRYKSATTARRSRTNRRHSRSGRSVSMSGELSSARSLTDLVPEDEGVGVPRRQQRGQPRRTLGLSIP